MKKTLLTNSVLFAILLFLLTTIVNQSAFSQNWQLIHPVYPTTDDVVAGYSVADYGATGDGVTDVTSIFQTRLNALGAAGGGTLWVPAGKYVISGNLLIPKGVTLRGDWQQPVPGQPITGTILMAYAGRGDTSATPFITEQTACAVMDLAIWYPQQDPNNIVPYPNAIQMGDDGFWGNDFNNAKNITLVNAYEGVELSLTNGGGCPIMMGIYGTPLSTGIMVDNIADVGRLENIDFSAAYWEGSGLPGSPSAGGAVEGYIYQHGTGILMRRDDWTYTSFVSVKGYNIGFRSALSIASPGAIPNGHNYGMTFTNCNTGIYFDGISNVGIMFANVTISNCTNGIVVGPGTTTNGAAQFHTCTIDATNAISTDPTSVGRFMMERCTISRGKVDIGGGTFMANDCDFNNASPQITMEKNSRSIITGNRFHVARKIVNNSLWLSAIDSTTTFTLKQLPAFPTIVPETHQAARQVMYLASAAPYNAKNDGTTDNTNAIQSALNQAAADGGGVVFLPPGHYRVNGDLTIAGGVELKGASDLSAAPYGPGSVLEVTADAGNATGTPFLKLAANSGVRGIVFDYPNQTGSLVPNFPAYPYTIQATGSNVYIINIGFRSVYNGIDLFTNKCDNHYVDFVCGQVFQNVFTVGGASTGGKIYNAHFNTIYYANGEESKFGSWPNSPTTDGDPAVYNYNYDNCKFLNLGNCQNETLYNDFIYGSQQGINLNSDAGAAPTGISLGLGIDGTRNSMNFNAIGAAGFDFINTQTVSLTDAGNRYITTTPTLASSNTTLFNSDYWGNPPNGIILNGGTVNLQQANFNQPGQTNFGQLTSGSLNVFGSAIWPVNAELNAGAEPLLNAQSSIIDSSNIIRPNVAVWKNNLGNAWAVNPIKAMPRTGWSATASVDNGEAQNALDSNETTRWATTGVQAPGQSYIVDMKNLKQFYEIALENAASSGDYPAGYAVYVSTDGTNWGSPIATGVGSSGLTIITFPTQVARYIKVVQTGTTTGNWWSIFEFYVFGVDYHAVTGVTVSPATATINVGATQQLKATINPTTASDTVVTWVSSDPTKATVDSTGLVTGVAIGTVTITATTQDGGITATSAITISNTLGTSSVPVSPQQFTKVEFTIPVTTPFTNAYDANEISLDMVATSPSGLTIVQPCFYNSGTSPNSSWMARFTPKETGNYTYFFRLTKAGTVVANSSTSNFTATATTKDGFLHTVAGNDWILKFDDGKPFKGIGEDYAWQPRNYEDQKYVYSYMLPRLAADGANFFRTWMCPWNLPLEWKNPINTNFYSSSTQYFNPSAIAGMDSLVNLSEANGMYMMLTLNTFGDLIDQWSINNYNSANGGPCATPNDFFASTAAKTMFKNRLRYIIARWGYSSSIAALELFNEIDNAVYGTTPNLTQSDVTQWHNEMSQYIKSIDPYGHMVTTSISYRDITGLNSAVPGMDFNQQHIYSDPAIGDIITNIPSTIRTYDASTAKPYSIGEYGYDWRGPDATLGLQNDSNYRRGLWYGIFSPTPIAPMSWWWEMFDDRGTPAYLHNIQDISNKMIAAGGGVMSDLTVSGSNLPEKYGAHCGSSYFVYARCAPTGTINTNLTIAVSGNYYDVSIYNTTTGTYTDQGISTAAAGTLTLPVVTLGSGADVIMIATASAAPPPPTAGGLNYPALLGYWQNWDDPTSPFIPLDQVDPKYNNVIVAFATPINGNEYQIGFTPYNTTQATFITQIQTLQSQGRKVLISIGGEGAPVSITSTAQEAIFVSSVESIINTYGFDGVDIDFEGTSLSVTTGSTIATPVDAPEIYLIAALKQIMQDYRAAHNKKLLLTLAPETADVQGGMSAYGGVWGSYLPIINGLKDSLDVLQVQLYNSGTMYGLDGNVYTVGTADFIVAETEAAIKGFTTAGGLYAGLPANKVAVGLPSCVTAAGSGFTDTATVHAAMNYLLGKGPKPGSYTLEQPGGYPTLEGMMDWSINYDKFCSNDSYAVNFDNIFDSTTVPTSTETPYGGTPWPIPGTIQSEDYDNGGQGTAYNDSDPTNDGGQYRPTEGVDIEASADGGYDVGYTAAGEWLKYTVNVVTPGIYTMQSRVAANSATGAFHVNIDATNISGSVAVPNTGGFQYWQTINTTTTYLTAGQHVMTVFIDAAGFNINYITFAGPVTAGLTASIAAPINNVIYNAPASLPITANVSTSTGTITKVEFYANGTKIGESDTAPYTFNWTGVATGTYSITAKVTNSSGATTMSIPVVVTVNPAIPSCPLLTWSDEFNGNSLDLTKWGYQTGNGCPGICGWGNNELEYYTNNTNNVSVSGGALALTAQYQPNYNGSGNNYTSGKILTVGNFSQKYGHFEARIKVPSAAGTWPAFWMLADSTAWPQTGEIDIEECANKNPITWFGTLHFANAGGSHLSQGYTYNSPAPLSDDYHLYAADWTTDSISFYVDSVLRGTVSKTALIAAGGVWPFDSQKFYIILNLAVGGNFTGQTPNPTDFPQTMLVDYVRVYSKDPCTAVPETPYGGTPWPIPGTIQAENYDNGGQGVAYNDSDPTNDGGQYRTTEGVDVETCSDTGGGYDVGYTAAGEWEKYTVNVNTAGVYTMQARVASTTAGNSLHVEIDGVTIGTIAVPNTGNFQTFQTVSVTTPALTTGQHIMRIYMETGGFNLNYVTFLLPTAVPVITSAATASGTVNTAFNYAIVATNTPTSFAVGGTLPAGITINTVTGVISGTPTVTGTFIDTVKAINAGGTGTQVVTITINAVAAGCSTSMVVNATSVPVIDGTVDAVWSNAPKNLIAQTISGTIQTGSTWQAMYDATNLYVLVQVKDANLSSVGTNIYDQDGVELFLSGNNSKAGAYTALDHQYRFNWNVAPTIANITGNTNATTGITYAIPASTGGYTLEAAIPWTTIGGVAPYNGEPIGFDVDLNDQQDNSGARDATAGWYLTNNDDYQNTAGFGTVNLTVCAATTPAITSAPTASGTVGTIFTYGITATNTPTTYTVGGTLPAGITINTSTGVISGIPTGSGIFVDTLKATNAGGTGTQILTITINPATPVVTSNTATGTVGTAFTYTISAANTPIRYTATP